MRASCVVNGLARGGSVQKQGGELRPTVGGEEETEKGFDLHDLLSGGAGVGELGGRGAVGDVLQRQPREAAVRHSADIPTRHLAHSRAGHGGCAHSPV